MNSLIAPHGGTLINRLAEGAEADAIRARAASLPKLTLNNRQASDFEMIANGAFSPLTGFMSADQYQSVIDTKHLPGGKLAWTIPITLAPEDSVSAGVEVGSEIALQYEDGSLAGIII